MIIESHNNEYSLKVYYHPKTYLGKDKNAGFIQADLEILENKEARSAYHEYCTQLAIKEANDVVRMSVARMIISDRSKIMDMCRQLLA